MFAIGKPSQNWDDAPANLTVRDVRRLGRNQKFYDRRPRNSQLKRARYPVGVGGFALFPAVTGASFAVGTMASPTSGSVTIWEANPSTGALSAGSRTVTAYNTWNTAIASGKQVLIYTYMGCWYIAGTDCA
jgi:hypothetical protein